MRVDPKYIKNLQGKDFVLFQGLLDLAHQDGLKSVATELIQIPNKENGVSAIVQAIVVTEKGSFTGLGDADPSNVNKMIAKHLLRMAETRSIARALRIATNVGMTAFEELGGDDSPPASKAQKELITKTCKERGVSQNMLKEMLFRLRVTWKGMTKTQAQDVLAELEDVACPFNPFHPCFRLRNTHWNCRKEAAKPGARCFLATRS